MLNLPLILAFLSIIIMDTSLASTQAPKIKLDSAIKQAISIVVGEFTGHSYQESWKYDDQFDEDGTPISITQVVNIHKFRIKEILAGDDLKGVINISIPDNGIGESITNQTQEVDIVLNLIEDTGAANRGSTGYNIVYSHPIEINDDSKLEQLKNKIERLRQDEPQHPDAQIEDDFTNDLEWQAEHMLTENAEKSPSLAMDDPYKIQNNSDDSSQRTQKPLYTKINNNIYGSKKMSSSNNSQQLIGKFEIRTAIILLILCVLFMFMKLSKKRKL